MHEYLEPEFIGQEVGIAGDPSHTAHLWQHFHVDQLVTSITLSIGNDWANAQTISTQYQSQ